MTIFGVTAAIKRGKFEALKFLDCLIISCDKAFENKFFKGVLQDLGCNKKNEDKNLRIV